MGKMADRITRSQVRSREQIRPVPPSGRFTIGIGTLDHPSLEPMRSLCVTIISRHDCHLCRVVHRVAEQLQQEVSFDLVVLDAEGETRAAAEYGDRVPVVLIDGKEALSGKVTGAALRRAIKKRVGETL